MFNLFAAQSALATLVVLVLLVVKVVAVVDAAIRPGPAFVAAGKLTKTGWLLILGLSLVAAIVMPSVFGILSIIGTVATFVYLLDVRPALRAITRR